MCVRVGVCVRCMYVCMYIQYVCRFCVVVCDYVCEWGGIQEQLTEHKCGHMV